MANHVSHAALPYPVKGAKFTLDIAAFDVNATLVELTTPVSKYSLDGAALLDCAEEPTNVTGAGSCLTLAAAEMSGSLVKLVITSANARPIYVSLQPRVLPILYSDVAAGGGSNVLVLPGTVPSTPSLVGCIIKTTGAGSGPGQARMISSHSGPNAFVVPNWETLVAFGTGFDILQTEFSQQLGGAGGGLTAPQVATAVWDALTSAHVVANSMGVKLGTFAFTGTNVHSHVQAGTLSGVLDAPTLDAIADAVIADHARPRFDKSCATVIVCTGCSGGTSGVLSCTADPNENASNWKDRLLTFVANTTTPGLRGVQVVIQSGGSVGSIPISPVLPANAVSTDVAVIT